MRLKRLAMISFFLGLNIVLGIYFIKDVNYNLPPNLVEILDKVGLIKDQKMFNLEIESIKEPDLNLDPQLIFKKLNEERNSFGVDELEYSDSLASAATILLDEAKKYNYNLEGKDFSEELKASLKKVSYNYSHVSHNMVVGPMSEQAVVDSWFSDEQQIEAIKNDDFTNVGFATRFADLEGIGGVGIVVQVLAKPMDEQSTKSAPQAATTPIKKELYFPVISDEEVFKALNNYRSDHEVQSLNINQNLCDYAEKRVQDLIAFGGLDEHEGFKKDFEDLENLPEPIKNYSGTSIAENLAHQYCKNMTTGDSFIAQTGTAIIEWCFDSSTKGHREAQLNKDYRDACVRHGQHMYVVIFGE